MKVKAFPHTVLKGLNRTTCEALQKPLIREKTLKQWKMISWSDRLGPSWSRVMGFRVRRDPPIGGLVVALQAWRGGAAIWSFPVSRSGNVPKDSVQPTLWRYQMTRLFYQGAFLFHTSGLSLLRNGSVQTWPLLGSCWSNLSSSIGDLGDK